MSPHTPFLSISTIKRQRFYDKNFARWCRRRARFSVLIDVVGSGGSRWNIAGGCFTFIRPRAHTPGIPLFRLMPIASVTQRGIGGRYGGYAPRSHVLLISARRNTFRDRCSSAKAVRQPHRADKGSGGSPRSSRKSRAVEVANLHGSTIDHCSTNINLKE